MKRWALLLPFLLLGVLAAPTGDPYETQPLPAPRPNILFILADDLDLRTMGPLSRTRESLASKGTTFRQAFVTTSVCCPARASILRGQYTHNHTIFTNHETEGGYRKFHESDLEESTVATWLRDEGYLTIMIGKYLNWYDGKDIPPGWDRWHGQLGKNNNHKYNENGAISPYNPDRYHDTDLFRKWAVRYIRNGAGKKRPFFMYLAINAPHIGASPAPRYKDRYRAAKAPRTPSFNEEDVSDKPSYIQDKPFLTEGEIQQLDKFHRARMGSMLSVDDMVERLVLELKKTGELENTYMIFTSDHGFHMGQHRLDHGKKTAYEEDVRVPLIVRGPGVPEGRVLSHMVLNIDFAPTFADIAGTAVPAFVDGRSFKPLLGDTPPSTSEWRQSFLLEGYTKSFEVDKQIYDYRALRTDGWTYISHSDGQRELYNLDNDPHQLFSWHDSPAHGPLIDSLDTRLEELSDCAGAACRAAEDAPLE